MRKAVIGIGVWAIAFSPANAQRVDAAVEVASGLSVLSADLKVEIVDGISAIGADEKWEVVGVCSNRPTLKVEIVTGLSALSAKRRVEIVKGMSVLSADWKICITNARSLDRETLKLLKLID